MRNQLNLLNMGRNYPACIPTPHLRMDHGKTIMEFSHMALVLFTGKGIKFHCFEKKPKKCVNSPDEKSDNLLTSQVKSGQEGEVGEGVAPDDDYYDDDDDDDDDDDGDDDDYKDDDDDVDDCDDESGQEGEVVKGIAPDIIQVVIGQ